MSSRNTVEAITLVGEALNAAQAIQAAPQRTLYDVEDYSQVTSDFAAGRLRIVNSRKDDRDPEPEQGDFLPLTLMQGILTGRPTGGRRRVQFDYAFRRRDQVVRGHSALVERDIIETSFEDGVRLYRDTLVMGGYDPDLMKQVVEGLTCSHRRLYTEYYGTSFSDIPAKYNRTMEWFDQLNARLL